MAKIEINTRLISALADTGCDGNLISLAQARQMSLKINTRSSTTLTLPNKSCCRTVGTVEIEVAFPDEAKKHWVRCHVLDGAVFPVVLGRQFLQATETLTKYAASRVQKIPRQLSASSRVNFMNERSYVKAKLEGRAVSAIPDTGSDVNLISSSYARARGFHVSKHTKHRKLLEFMDGSRAFTTGVVRGLHFEYDISEWEVYKRDFWVLEGLSCDVLLANKFVFETSCFDVYGKYHVDVLEDIDSFRCNGIREKLMADLNVALRAEAKALDAYEVASDEAEGLPPEEQEALLAPYTQQWEESKHRSQTLSSIVDGIGTNGTTVNAQGLANTPIPISTWWRKCWRRLMSPA